MASALKYFTMAAAIASMGVFFFELLGLKGSAAR
jgi:hypothetical protein